MDTGDKQPELLHRKTILSHAPANDLTNAGRDLGTEQRGLNWTASQHISMTQDVCATNSEPYSSRHSPGAAP